MKITDVRVLQPGRWVFVEIETDDGLVGLGEAGAFGVNDAQAAILNRLRDYLVGKDPLKQDHHYQYLYRSSHFRGAALMGALSAIDIALWDIAGKHFGVPAGVLLGGRCREKIRAYCHVRGATIEEMEERIRECRAKGFTAVGHLSPFLKEGRQKPWFKATSRLLADAAEHVRRYRDAAGLDVDLCIEIHRRLRAAEAISLARMIEPYHPLFYEDPVRPDNLDEMAYVARMSPVPIATGERLQVVDEFLMLIERRAVAFVRPDICLCGGITQCKKVAALAESAGVRVVPHNPRSLSPVSTAAAAQLASCVPNADLIEFPGDEDSEQKSSFEVDGYTVTDGFVVLSDAPGIGVTLSDELRARPNIPRGFVTRLHVDGSVVDS